MRGKALSLICLLASGGITPAYAGKSIIGGDCMVFTEDHPRLCGEKSSMGALMLKAQGSPPPMRGKAVRYSRAADSLRITPAYAGKSFRPHTMMQ